MQVVYVEVISMDMIKGTERGRQERWKNIYINMRYVTETTSLSNRSQLC
jgi:hypothetical protein